MDEATSVVPDYEVFAIRYAHREALRFEHFYERVDCGNDPMAMDYFVWMIRGPEMVIIVDTGFTHEVATARGRDWIGSPLDSLKKLGVDAKQVKTVVLTHLHFDHTGHVHGFPEAQFILQESEMSFWCGRHAGRPHFAHLCTAADLSYLVTANLEGRVRMLTGDITLAPGITVHHVGGHTPGSQVVRIETNSGPVVLASDASHYFDNIEKDRPYAIVHTLPVMYEAFDRINELAGPNGRVVAGHDPEVLVRFAAPAPEFEGLVVKIA